MNSVVSPGRGAVVLGKGESPVVDAVESRRERVLGEDKQRTAWRLPRERLMARNATVGDATRTATH